MCSHPTTSATATSSSHASHPGHCHAAQSAPRTDLPCQRQVHRTASHSAATPDTSDVQPNCQPPATIGGTTSIQSPADTVPTNLTESRAVGTLNATASRRPTRPAHHIVVEPVHPHQGRSETEMTTPADKMAQRNDTPDGTRAAPRDGDHSMSWRASLDASASSVKRSTADHW